MSKKYTLVIEGTCPAIYADMKVYVDFNGTIVLAGEIKGVMFDDALEVLEEREEKNE